MFGYELGFPGNWFSKKPSSSFLENEIRNKLKGLKETTKVFKEGDNTITEVSYTGDGFSYTETTHEYTPDTVDLEIYQLEGELEKAVDNENYADAANIKNKIKELKKTKTNDTSNKDN